MRDAKSLDEIDCRQQARTRMNDAREFIAKIERALDALESEHEARPDDWRVVDDLAYVEARLGVLSAASAPIRARLALRRQAAN